MEFLRELFSEPLSFEAFQKVVTDKGIKLADLASGKYADVEKLTKANGELKEARETIQKMGDEVQALRESKASAEEWEKRFNDLTAEIKKRDEAAQAEAEEKSQTAAIESVFGDKKFTSDYVRRGLIADMKAEIAKPENKGKGYTEIFEALTKDKEGLFANPNPPINVPGLGDVALKGDKTSIPKIF